MDAAAPGNVVYGWDPTFLGAPHDDLPTAQGLDAEVEATNGQGPVAYPCYPELQNRYDKPTKGCWHRRPSNFHVCLPCSPLPAPGALGREHAGRIVTIVAYPARRCNRAGYAIR